MKSDRNENFEAPEESEYHFSDEEAGYEVEPETESPKQPAPTGAEPGVSFLNRLTRSKRMLISLGVFLVLIFIVYKVIAPPTTPTTEITPAVATNQQKPMAAPSKPANASAVQYAPQNPIVHPTMPPTQAETIATAPPPVATVPIQPTVPTQPVVAAQPVVTTQPIVTTQPVSPVAGANIPQTVPTSNVVPVVTTSPIAPVPQVSPMTQPAQQPTAPVATQTEIPMQSTVPTGTPGIVSTQLPADVNAKIVTMSQENQKLILQLQADYTQKMNDFLTQNKSLQDQVQLLSSRVASVETEMNRLVQTLSRQTAINTMKPSQPPPHISEGPPPRIPFVVQAIIPGRAWLKADSGETVTITEGDVIKGLGRVSKIDPYDGVVEINTGSRVLSLSYGSGG